MADETTKLNETFQQIKQMIIEMPLMKKLSIVLTIGISLSVLVFLGQLSSQSGYQVLFSNLESEDLSAIASSLEGLGIPYEIQSEAQAILVPADDVLTTRLKLAREGLPQFGGVGFELFDQDSFGMTDFEQRLNYQRALQGELVRTINEFKEVDDSRIHLVIPEKSLFMQSKEVATASVVLKLAKGEKIQEETVRSIVNLVSASVPNLDAKNVTVVDTTGQLLSSEMGEESGGGLAVFRKKRDLEMSYETKVRSLLEPIVGFGKVKVRVTADMDFTSKETTEEKFDPESIAVRSESRTKNKESEAGDAAAAAAAAGKEKDQQSESINYEVSKQVQHIKHASGELQKLSIATIIDGTYEEGEDGEKTYQPRSEDDMKKFEDLIKSAIGFNQERGDQLKVMNLAFQSPESLFKEGSEQQMFDKSTYAFYLSIIVNVVIAVIALLIILFVIKPLITAWREKQGAEGALAGGNKMMLPPGAAKDELERKALEDPADMVKILRKWLE
ncbi:MAG: flagellar M-ring protein FliF [Deltaproteobacteria bacterium]|nr:flagellar M-ring protein FliF [Deltaproteobacteria bacterium]